MVDKTPHERFDGAVAELKKLESEGFDCGPVKRLSLSATARALPKEEPKQKAPAKNEDANPEGDKPGKKSVFVKG